MAVNVNLPPIRVPDSILELLGDEAADYFNKVNFVMYQMWRRQGGANDLIDETQLGELYEPGIQTSDVDELVDDLEVSQEMSMILDLSEQIEELQHQIATFSPLKEFESISTSTAFTTTGDQIVICTNTTPVTHPLNAAPDDGEEVIFKRQNTGSVTISGTIDGASSITLLSRYDAPHLVFSVDAGEWSIV